MRKLENVTFGVSSIGNTQALCMCLASVLNATVVPARIQIRLEGKLPEFAHFYLEQISELARFKGVDWIMQVANPRGVRAARDWQLDNCRTPYLWMGDDDAIYTPQCLEAFEAGIVQIEAMRQRKDWAYCCGSKPDVNNRRGYGDFNRDIHYAKDLQENAAFNFFWDADDCWGTFARIQTCDTGNMFLKMSVVNANKLRFTVFEDSLNSGGEDTIFGLRCKKAGLDAWFIPSAVAYHLEKPQVNFSEFAARGEMVLRTCDLLDLDKTYLKKTFMPWLFKH
jgi:hypothetical protein